MICYSIWLYHHAKTIASKPIYLYNEKYKRYSNCIGDFLYYETSLNGFPPTKEKEMRQQQ